MTPCKFCSGSTAYVLRLYKNHMKKTDIDPKWLPHIWVKCVTCGHAQGDALKQTEELRTELDGMALVEIDFEALKNERRGEIDLKIPLNE